MSKTTLSSVNRLMTLSLLVFLLTTNSSLLAQCSLTCQSSLNVTLDPACESLITPETMIKNINTTACSGPFIVELYTASGDLLPTNPMITGDYVGQSLQAKAIDTNTGIYCWGNLNIEDKLGPNFICEDDTVRCNEAISPIVVNDSCDPNPTVSFVESVNDLNCSDPNFLRIITRTWTATDASGMSNTCVQLIRVEKPNLSDIVFPTNLDGINGPMLDCDNPDLSIDNTGEPTIFGAPVEGFCKLNFSYKDQYIDICEGSYKVLRTWTALDCCTSEIRTHIQIIKVADTTAPIITCPNDFTMSTDFDQCVGTVLLPLATVEDDCSSTANIDISMTWAFGDGRGPFYDIPLGPHTVTYTATDDCGNSSTCTMEVTIEDQVSPVAVCNSFTTVSLSTDLAKVFAVTFDDGSEDNCAIGSYSARRMEDAVFTDCVYFNCEDVNDTVMVVFQVCDTAGLCNICMVSVFVQDKKAPTIICPADISLTCDDYPPSSALTGLPTFDDNCEIDTTYFLDKEMLNSCNVGSIIRTWYAVDKGGLIDSCDQTIIIGDDTPPVYTFPEDIDVQCWADADPDNSGRPTIMDNCDNFIATGKDDDIFTLIPNCKYKIVREWTLDDDCNNNTLTDLQIIVIEDTQAPIFDTAPITSGISFACLDGVIFPTPPTATDNCSDEVEVNLVKADTLSGNCPDDYFINLTYVAVDSCGNISTPYLLTLTVNDTIPPTANPLDPIGPFDCVIKVDPFNTDLIVNEVDNCGGPVTVSFIGDATPPTCSGNYIRTYQLSDQCGNTTTLTQTIIILDDSAPTAGDLNNIGPFDCIAMVPTSNINDLTNVMDNCSNNITITPITDIGTPGCVTTYLRSYQLDDGCGNTTNVTQTILINDQTPPVWNEVAGSLDINSECGDDVPNIISPTATDFCNNAMVNLISDDTTSFICKNNYVRVIRYQAVDDCNNQSTPFDLTITVLDQTPPVWSTPIGGLDRNFTCAADLVEPAIPVATDICDGARIELISDNITAQTCVDQFVRTLTYHAFDSCDLRTTEPFIITLTVNDDAAPLWDQSPGDLDSTFTCAQDLVIPLPPTAMDNCSRANVALVQDDTLNLDCANKYTRRLLYQATDECGNVQGGLFPVTLIVNDTIPPMITFCPGDMEVDDLDFFPQKKACGEPFDITAIGTDNCGNTSFSYTRSDMPGVIFQGANINDDFPTGTTVVKFYAKDACNNQDSCDLEIIVNDVSEPDIGCTSFDIAPTGGVPTVLVPQDFLSTVDDCSSTTLTFATGDPNQQTFTCADAGTFPNPNIVPMIIVAEDSYGNSITCDFDMAIYDVNCPTAQLAEGQSSVITGYISTPDGEYSNNINVQISGGLDTIIQSNDQGRFAFPQVEMYNDYTITPSYNEDLLNGVNTLDLVMIARHLLRIETLNSPYQLIAADVNNSGNLSPFDMVILTRTLLLIEDNFLNNTSWRFIDEKYNFPDPANPFSTVFPENITIPNLSEIQLNRNFLAIKVGDVNQSVQTNGFTESSDTRSEDLLTLSLEEEILEAGKSYVIEFKAKDFSAIHGYQFTLDFDPTMVEFERIEKLSPTLQQTPNNFGLKHLDKGMIITNWYNQTAQELAAEDLVFALKFKALSNTTISQTFQITSAGIAAEAYDLQLGVMDVNLFIDNESTVANNNEKFRLHQNRPNPFKNETVISFELPEDQPTTLTIMDVTGQILKEYQGPFQKGYNELTIRRSELPGNSIFFYQLQSGNFRASQKMIMTRF